jgi:hypothetical protein
VSIFVRREAEVPFPRRGSSGEDADFVVANEDASRFAVEAGELVEAAVGVTWYGAHDNQVDAAALALCRLRRASAGVRGATEEGDAAVRRALEAISPEAVTWLASRAISYMDESGFPEAVEMWFPEPDVP